MAVIQVPGELSGRAYSVRIGGETPTATEAARIQNYVRQQEEAFRQHYAQRFGEELDFPDSTAFGRGWDVGRTSAYSALGTTARDVGEATGIDFLRNLGQGMEERARMEQIAEAGRMPAPTRMEDVEGVGSFLTWLGEGAGQSGPEMAATLGATALGSLAGPGGAIGAGTATAMPFFYGRNIQRQEETGEEVNRFNAFLAAGGQSVLNSIGERLLLAGRALGLAIPASERLFVRVAQRAGASAAVEAPTEITQQILERAQAGLPLDSDDAIQEYLEAGILGGLIGGGVGAGLAPFSGPPAAPGAAPPARGAAPSAGAGPSVPPTTATPTSSAPGVVPPTRKRPPAPATPAAPTTAPTTPAAAPATPAAPTTAPTTPAAAAAAAAPTATPPAPSVASVPPVAAPTTSVEQTRQLLTDLRVPSNLNLWRRLEQAGVGPDSPQVRAELESLLRVMKKSPQFATYRAGVIGPNNPITRIEQWLAQPMATPAAPAPSTTPKGPPDAPPVTPTPEAPRAIYVAPDPTTDFKVYSEEEAFEAAALRIQKAFDAAARRAADERAARDRVPSDREVVGDGRESDADTGASAAPERDGLGAAVPDAAEPEGRGGEQQPALSGVRVSGVDDAELREEREAIQAESEAPPSQALVDDVPFDDVPFDDVPPRPDLQGVDPFESMIPVDGAPKGRRFTEDTDEKGGIPMPEYLRFDPQFPPTGRQNRRRGGAGRAADITELAAQKAADAAAAAASAGSIETPSMRTEGMGGAPTPKDAARGPIPEGIPPEPTQPRAGSQVSEAVAAADAERRLAAQAAEELRADWEARVASQLPEKLRKLEAFTTPNSELKDPSTSRDRRAVLGLLRGDRKGAGSKASKTIFEKYPSVVEALDVIAELRARDPRVTTLINNLDELPPSERELLEGYDTAADFFDSGLNQNSGVNAQRWVADNLGPEANAYLEGKILKFKVQENAIKARTGKHDPVEMARVSVRNIKDMGVLMTAFPAAKSVENVTAAIQSVREGTAIISAVKDAAAVNATRKGPEVQLDTSMATVDEATVIEERKALLRPPSYMRGWNGTEIAVARAFPEENLNTKKKVRDKIKSLTEAEVDNILLDTIAVRESLKLSRKFKVLRDAERLELPLSAMATRALLRGNLKGALQDVAATSESAEIRAVARTILANIGDTKVYLYDLANPDLRTDLELSRDRGSYFPTQDTVTLNEAYGPSVQTLLHEAAHAVTFKYFSENPDSPLSMDMKALFSATYETAVPYMYSVDYRKDGRVPTPEEVTTTELLEFVAEIRTNSSLRNALRSLSLDDLRVPRKTMAANALEWVGQLYRRLMRMLGRRSGTPDLLAHADQLIDFVMTPERAAGDVLFAAATRPGMGVSSIMDVIRPARTAALNPKTREKFADDAREIMSNGTGLSGRFVLGFLPQLALGDLAARVGIDTPYRMGELIGGRDAAFSRETADVDIVMDRLSKFAKAYPDSYKTLSRLMTSSSVEGADLSENPTTPAASDNNFTKFWLAFDRLDKDGNILRTERRWYNTMPEREAAIAAMNASPAKNRSAARHAGNARDPVELSIIQKLKDDYNSMPPEARAMYVAVRDFYQSKYDRLWALLQGEIDTLLGSTSEAAANAKQSVYVRIFDKGQIRPYFPLVREGAYWLEFSAFNPATSSTEPVKMTFETKGARDRMIMQLDSVPGVVKDPTSGAPQVFTYTASNMGAPNFRTDAMFVRGIMKIFDEHNAAAPAGKKISDDIMNDIAALITKSAPEGSMARQLHKRNNTPGYTEDALAGLREKGYRLAQSAPRLQYSREIRSLQNKYRDALAKNANEQQQMVLEELIRLGNDVLSPMDSPADRAAQVANRIAYAYTLLGNLSAVLVNTSSMANVIYPQVGGRYGFNRAAKSLTRASKMFMSSGTSRVDTNPVSFGGDTTTTLKALPSIDNYYVLERDGSFSVRPDKTFSAEHRRQLEDMAPLVRMLSERGMLHHSILFDSAGIEDSTNQRGVVSRMFAFFGAPFHVVERMNRQVAAMAVYEMELAKLRADERAAPTGRTDAELQEAAAAEAVYQSQNMNGGASLNTAPRFAQRGLGRVALMYKSYGLTVTTLLFKTARQVVTNAFPDTPEGRVERDIAMRQMMGHLGATFVLAGVAGLPMYGLARMIGDMLREEDEISFDEATRIQLGEMLYKGPVNALTGFEISSRTGLSGLLYRANPYMQDASAEEQLVTLLGGPAWSIFSQIRRGARDLQEGEYARGFEAITPLAVSNFLRAARFAREGGAMTRGDNFIYEDMTTSEILGRAVGFNPAELVRRQARSSEAVRIGQTVQEQRTRLIERLFLAYRSGDTEGAQQAIEDIQEFNRTVGQRYPGAIIDDDGVRDSFDRRVDTIVEMMNGVSVNPQVRATLVQQMGAIYDGLTPY